MSNLRHFENREAIVKYVISKNPCHDCAALQTCKDHKNGKVCDSIVKEWLDKEVAKYEYERQMRLKGESENE